MAVHPAVRRSSRVLGVATVGVGLAVSLAGPASAREKAAGSVITFSSPVPAPTSGCAVKSFKHDSVTGIGDTGLSAVSADWSMRACDSKSAITVEVAVVEEFNKANVLYDDASAPESGQVTVSGIALETWYRITVTARDARTGATVGTATALEIAHRPTGA
jgi:hypothetical protein